MNTTASLLLSFEEDHPVRIAGTPESPLFVAADVCDVLGIKNSRDAVAALDEDERASVTISDTSSSSRKTITVQAVTESGLYHLIFKSRKETAKRFRRWVTEEVLPEIRRNGSYLHASQSDPFEALLENLGRESSEAVTAADIAIQRVRVVAARRDEAIRRLRDAVPFEVTAGGMIAPGPFNVRDMEPEALISEVMERFDITRGLAYDAISRWLLTGRAVSKGGLITIP